MTGTQLDFHEISELKLLRANGLTFFAISQKLKRDPKTIKKICLDPETAQDIAEMQEELADAYECLSRRMIESITDDDILALSAYQRCISAGICTDKMRLLRNESTSNVSMLVIDANIKDLDKREAELQKELEAMQLTIRKEVKEY